jgi:hypothetical protein
MSDKARKLIKQAIKLHLTEDGASDMGAYRDVITEVLHLAKKKFKDETTLESLKYRITDEGFESFVEEQENNELAKVDRIPDKNLPLHSVDEFEFELSKERFIERLKGKSTTR